MFPENRAEILQSARAYAARESESLIPEEIKELIDLTSFELDFMKSALTQENARQRVKEILSEVGFSLPQAIAIFIREGSELFQYNAWVDLEGGKPTFLFWHDFTQGMSFVSSLVTVAEGDIAGKTDEMIISTLETEDIEGRKYVQTQTEFFLNMRSGVKRWSDLFVEDPSGFTLVDEYINFADEEFGKPQSDRSHFIPIFTTPDFFLMGARFARDLYHAAYEAVKE